MKLSKAMFAVTLLLAGTTLFAGGYQDLLKKYEAEAGAPLDAAKGKELFQKKVGDKSCTGCHNEDITKEGHEKFWIFSKSIGAMALSANAKRYKDADDTEEEFDKYCKEVFDRVCTAKEKGDILLYLTQS